MYEKVITHVSKTIKDTMSWPIHNVMNKIKINNKFDTYEIKI